MHSHPAGATWVLSATSANLERKHLLLAKSAGLSCRGSSVHRRSFEHYSTLPPSCGALLVHRVVRQVRSVGRTKQWKPVLESKSQQQSDVHVQVHVDQTFARPTNASELGSSNTCRTVVSHSLFSPIYRAGVSGLGVDPREPPIGRSLAGNARRVDLSEPQIGRPLAEGRSSSPAPI
ncbi:hypothetical protein T07_10215 [Trichinella nelsoni]|uniref:Uncharacterized protein n=1 Tax=Trichinella nelsoni TaxID=6336 RepID=A0A0V0RE12_9BILA|nr:hypothetical protein T07_10215 [Trichinella nelsoni]